MSWYGENVCDGRLMTSLVARSRAEAVHALRGEAADIKKERGATCRRTIGAMTWAEVVQNQRSYRAPAAPVRAALARRGVYLFKTFSDRYPSNLRLQRRKRG